MDTTILILWVGGGLGVLMLIIGIVVSYTERQALVEERLGQYLDDDEYGDEGEVATPLTNWINTRVEGSTFGTNISRELARADLKLKPGEYVALLVIFGFLFAIIGYFWFRGSVLSAVVGGLIGIFLPRFYIKRQQKQRLVQFNDQLPDMLNLMVNGLRAGYSNMQAMEAVSKEMPAPIAPEFRRVVREMQLGITLPEALDNLLRRIPSPDLDLIVTAINIQREVGGNLAEILDIIAYTIGERIRIKREIETLTAQVLYSGRILAVLPIALGFFLATINESYMQQFWLPENRICGLSMLGAGAIMIAMGYYVMTRIADIEI